MKPITPNGSIPLPPGFQMPMPNALAIPQDSSAVTSEESAELAVPQQSNSAVVEESNADKQLEDHAIMLGNDETPATTPGKDFSDLGSKVVSASSDSKDTTATMPSESKSLSVNDDDFDIALPGEPSPVASSAPATSPLEPVNLKLAPVVDATSTEEIEDNCNVGGATNSVDLLSLEKMEEEVQEPHVDA